MMNLPKHIAKNIVSETFDELGVEVPTELHENRRLKRFIDAFHKAHPNLKLNGLSKNKLEKLADDAIKLGDGSSESFRMLRTLLYNAGATGMIRRVNEKLKVSETFNELGVEVPTELHEAWTADSVKKNSDIGSDRGYGITLKPHKNPNKHKHMLMMRGAGGKVKVEFDFGKKPEDVFVGTPQEVADHINKVLGLKEQR